MSEPLLFAYAHTHPTEFAALLVRYPFEEGVAVLHALPDVDALSVLAVLPGSHLRRVLEAFGDEDVAPLLTQAHFELAAALLLRLRPERRGAILERLPSRRLRRDLEARLSWDEGSLGAVAARNFVAVPAAATIADLVREMRAFHSDAEVEPDLFVLDDGGRLRGEVDLRRAVANADSATPVLRCLLTHQSLPADMPARVAVDLPLWRRFTSVPVVDRERRLVGTVTLALLRDAARVDERGDDSLAVVADLSWSFLDVLSALLGQLFGGGRATAGRASAGGASAGRASAGRASAGNESGGERRTRS